MTDNLEAAPEAVEEVVQDEVEQTSTPEAADSTEGTPAEAPAEGEAEETTAEPEDKGPTRAERRRQARERSEAALKEAQAKAADAERRAQEIRDAAKSVPAPKQNDFDSYEEYQAALSSYRTLGTLDDREARQREAEAKTHFKQVEELKKQQQAEDAQSWADQVAEGKTKYPDFEQVAQNPNLPITEKLANMMLQSDVAADMAYHLGKNPTLAQQISSLDEVQMARAVGRLEAQVSAPKPKPTSSAPDPITPVKGKATALKNPDEMTYQEYEAARKAGKIK